MAGQQAFVGNIRSRLEGLSDLLFCLGKWKLYPIQRRSVSGLTSDEDESSISPIYVHPKEIFS